MSNQLKSDFILNFFTQLRLQNINHCILRGYEGLPETVGHDIDIFIERQNNIIDFVQKIVSGLGWEYYLKIEQDDFFTITCYTTDIEVVQVLQLDFWTSLNWRGIPWCATGEILTDIGEYNRFSIPAKGTEAAVTAIKELVGKGQIKEKYYQSLMEMSLRDAEKMEACLMPAFGDMAHNICDLCKTGEFARLDNLAGILRRQLIGINIYTYINNSLKRFCTRINSCFRPKGIMVAFIGPDGSGKTTVINMLEQYLGPFFDNVTKFHMGYNILPELRTGHGFSSMKGKLTEGADKTDEKKEKRSLISIFASWFVVLYYTLEFFLGNHIASKLKRKNNLILFDRYYYDQFIQPTTRDLIYPFRKLLLAFVKRPDIIIHLTADPMLVYKRKQELKPKEIEKQNQYIARLVKDINNSYTFDTTNGNADIIGKQIFQVILQKKQGCNS